MIALEREGLRHRVGLALRPQLLRWDDVERIEGGVVHGADGTQLRLDAAVLAEALKAWKGPLLASSLEEAASRLERWLSGPHGPRRVARWLVDAASALGASDVHVESQVAGAVVRLRLEGELVALCALSKADSQELSAALKGLAGCLPYRCDIAQEGRIERAGVCADVRGSFVPTALGERIALRLFGRLFSLESLGMSPAVLEALNEALNSKTGLLLVSGASGSGKTTTLYAALGYLATTRPGAHLSLEDPVEQRLRVAGVAVDQIELEPARGLTAEAMLVAALRQDVDVLAVGEIRTAAEARLALEAAHTGRLVLAGIHAGSPAEARQRMLDLGVEEGRLVATLRGVLHQELVTGPCGCASPAACDKCRGLGRRRQLVAELALPAGKASLRGVS
ncbi:MAG TPA: ATPase, T2SS/T4P/T4SS family [Myxococcales bacterium]|jgi:type II secretory ATPase GspE/PulE/Tfp pilus assembly ATPase PilB-like protein